MRNHLIDNNVAAEIATQLVDSVGVNLEGKEKSTFKGVSSIVKASLETTLAKYEHFLLHLMTSHPIPLESCHRTVDWTFFVTCSPPIKREGPTHSCSVASMVESTEIFNFLTCSQALARAQTCPRLLSGSCPTRNGFSWLPVIPLELVPLSRYTTTAAPF